MNNRQWHRDVERDSQRLKKAEHGRRSILVHTIFLGSLSILFLVPLVAGAYLGSWLDSLSEGYTVKWTVNLIILGIAVGVCNVYFFIRKYW